MIRFRVLGTLDLRGVDERVLRSLLSGPKRLALLAYLILANPRGFHRRDSLIALFWPESDTGHARNSLRNMLHLLRQALGNGVIVSRGREEIGIADDALWCDALEFEQALDEGRLADALDLYRGDLLTGMYVSKAAPALDHWLDRERERLRRQAFDAACALADGEEEDGDPAAAARWMRRALALSPYDERVLRRLMRLLQQAGDRAGPIRTYRRFARRFADEMQLEPSADTRALARKLSARNPPLESPAGAAEQPAPVPGANEARETAPAEEAAEPPPVAGAVHARARESSADAVHEQPSAGGRRPQRAAGRSFRPTLLLRMLPSTRGKLFAFALLALAGGTYLALRTTAVGPFDSFASAGAITRGERVILADFENHTSDPMLAVAVTEALRIDLSQSRLVRLAEPAFIAHILKLMERSPQGELDAETAREIAVREGLPAVVTGAVSEAGDGYLLLARIVAPASGAVLASHRVAAVGDSAVIPAIDRLSDALRARIGESLEAVRASKPLSEVTTASLDALRLFSQAVRMRARTAAPSRTLGLLNQAIRLDSTFAAAYRARGILLGSMGERRSAMVADIRRAFELREELTPRERHMAAGTYFRYVAGHPTKATAAYRRVLAIDPEFGPAYDQLGLLAFFHLRDWAAAERLFRRSIEVRPYPSYVPHVNLARSQFNRGEFKQARKTIETLDSILPGTPRGERHLAHFAAARGDYGAARSHLRAFLEDRSGTAYWNRIGSTYLGQLAQLQGKLAEAETFFEDALAAVKRAGAGSEYSQYAIRFVAVDLWFRHDSARALARLDSLHALVLIDSLEPPPRSYLALSGFYAYAGRPGKARAVLTEWERAVPDGRRRVLDGVWRLQRGAIALAEGRFLTAIEEFRRANELHANPVAALPQLGRVFELAGMPDSAVAAYERYLSTPYYLRAFAGVSPAGGGDWYWLPIVYQRLAALYETLGETGKAIEYYTKVVDLWADADPELQPRVEAATAAIERLRR